eukprot:CAMPEP_0177629578 /NCGR_PEP_ID=MMETSP0447-20121125/744_1 /TAXON_ID=0 /ORGANISM="Stygamoeba regulata, Strain BSH-02190019" /LENGTH=87 /DNA_ID=CAMNT_0019130911 /DNA_START=24 /DNA_END=287 /DNA_ORIENTATION=-
MSFVRFTKSIVPFTMGFAAASVVGGFVLNHQIDQSTADLSAEITVLTNAVHNVEKLEGRIAALEEANDVMLSEVSSLRKELKYVTEV